MTAEEICESTPWEINMRINGLKDRQRYDRLFTTNFITLPVYNSGFSRPKKGVSIEDILPKEDLEDEITQAEIDKWREILKGARDGRYNKKDSG